MTDEEIIEQIRSGDKNSALRILLKELPKVKANVLSNGGTKEDAQELFNDSLILLIEKVEDPTFVLSANIRSFLYGIARFLWLNELRKRKKLQTVTWETKYELTADEIGYDKVREEKLQAIEGVLDQISAKCKSILELFYYKQLSMQKIAIQLKFSSVNSAKTQKYKCLEKAIHLTKNL